VPTAPDQETLPPARSLRGMIPCSSWVNGTTPCSRWADREPRPRCRRCRFPDCADSPIPSRRLGRSDFFRPFRIAVEKIGQALGAPIRPVLRKFFCRQKLGSEPCKVHLRADRANSGQKGPPKPDAKGKKSPMPGHRPKQKPTTPWCEFPVKTDTLSSGRSSG
jgi:hypothetical protein